MEVVKVQLASFTIGSGSATGTGTLSGFDDTSKMVVFGSWDLPSRGTSFTGEDSMVKLEITSTTVVTATRIGTPSEVINVEAYVVQFGDDTNVYTGTFTMAGGGGTSPQTTTANINGGSAMTLNDLTKAFCWSYYTDDDSTSNDGKPEAQQVQTRFNSTSVIGFKRNNNPSALSGRWFVVESSTLTVQHLTSLFTATSNTTETATITTVSDINDTFVLSSYWTNESSFKDEGMWTVHLNSDSQLLFTRGFGASNDVEFESQIIQDSTIATQRGQWTGTGTTESTALSPNVDVDLTIALTGAGHPFHVASDDYNAGALDEFILKAKIPDLDQIDGASTAAPGAKTLGWQTVQFTEEGGAPVSRRVMVVS